MRNDENEYLREYAKRKAKFSALEAITFFGGILTAGSLIEPKSFFGYVGTFILGISIMWILRLIVLRLFY